MHCVATQDVDLNQSKPKFLVSPANLVERRAISAASRARRVCPSRSSPSVEFCVGTRPIQTARSRPIETRGYVIEATRDARDPRTDARDAGATLADLARSMPGEDAPFGIEDLSLHQRELVA